ncbi:aminoacyl-tRNA hydrolase, partial [Thermodesulfovibrionales bacterium]|nr:aminoacyl-tRNA hydrolase [Thermodesulfovibrionales bacterium]
MWVIVGLGNPGNKYSKTRHNIGFRVVDLLSARWGIAVEKTDMYLIGRGNIEGRGVTLLKPLTFMNRSGLAVRKVLKAMDIIS